MNVDGNLRNEIQAAKVHVKLNLLWELGQRTQLCTSIVYVCYMGIAYRSLSNLSGIDILWDDVLIVKEGWFPV